MHRSSYWVLQGVLRTGAVLSVHELPELKVLSPTVYFQLYERNCIWTDTIFVIRDEINLYGRGVPDPGRDDEKHEPRVIGPVNTQLDTRYRI